MGGALFISAAQIAFANQLIVNLAYTAPTVNPAAVVATGATEIRTAFPAAAVSGILRAYMIGIRAAFALSAGGAGVAFIASLFNKWTRLSREAVQGTGAA